MCTRQASLQSLFPVMVLLFLDSGGKRTIILPLRPPQNKRVHGNETERKSAENTDNDVNKTSEVCSRNDEVWTKSIKWMDMSCESETEGNARTGRKAWKRRERGLWAVRHSCSKKRMVFIWIHFSLETGDVGKQDRDPEVLLSQSTTQTDVGITTYLVHLFSPHVSS